MKFILKYIQLLTILLTTHSFAKNSNALPSGEDAFYKQACHYYDTLSMSPDGEWIAYTLKERVDNPTEFHYFLPDGTPTFMTQCHIYLSSRDDNEVRKVLTIEGDSWRPAWSPEGKELAFYSNASGQCSLWIYDLSSDNSKELCNLPIHTSIYPKDKPIWNPEGTEIYVPLALCNPLKMAGSQKSQGICSLAAIDMKTGAARIVISGETDPAPSYMKLSSSGRWLSYATPSKLLNHPNESSFDLMIALTKEKNQMITIARNVISQGGQDYLWHLTNDSLVYEKDNKIYLVELDEKGIKRNRVLFESATEFINTPLLLTQDGHFLIVGSKPCHEFNRDQPGKLFIVSLTDESEVSEIQFKSPWKYLSTKNASEPEVWQENQDEIAIILEKEDTGENTIVKLNIQRLIVADQVNSD